MHLEGRETFAAGETSRSQEIPGLIWVEGKGIEFRAVTQGVGSGSLESANLGDLGAAIERVPDQFFVYGIVQGVTHPLVAAGKFRLPAAHGPDLGVGGFGDEDQAASRSLYLAAGVQAGFGHIRLAGSQR